MTLDAVTCRNWIHQWTCNPIHCLFLSIGINHDFKKQKNNKKTKPNWAIIKMYRLEETTCFIEMLHKIAGQCMTIHHHQLISCLNIQTNKNLFYFIFFLGGGWFHTKRRWVYHWLMVIKSDRHIANLEEPLQLQTC